MAALIPAPILETTRLRLRPFTLADAGDVKRLAGERDIAATTVLIPHPYPDGLAAEWIASHAGEAAAGTALTLAITHRADAALVGAIALTAITADHQAELGYWTGRPYWNQGYCTEAARALVGFAFGTLGLVRIHAHHFARNPASGQVLRKLGMRHEGLLRQHILKWGVLEDVECYGLIRSEWASQGPPPGWTS